MNKEETVEQMILTAKDHLKEKEYKEALILLHKAYDICSEDSKEAGTIAAALGDLSAALGMNPEHTARYYRVAEATCRKTGNEKVLAELLLKKAEKHPEQKEADAWVEEAEQLCRNNNDRNRLCSTLILKGKRAAAHNQTEEALPILQEAFSLLDEEDDPDIRCSLLVTMGDLSYQLSRLQEAAEYYLGALRFSFQKHDLPACLELDASLAQVYVDQEDLNQAFSYVALSRQHLGGMLEADLDDRDMERVDAAMKRMKKAVDRMLEEES